MKKNKWQDRYKNNDNYYGNSTPANNLHQNPERSHFHSLKGKTVTLNKRGPESKYGKLLDIQSDYMTLYTSSKVVIYYHSKHIKSIIEDTKSNSTPHILDHVEKVEYVIEKNFNGLLKKLENQVIQINQGGPNHRHGTLLAVRSDFLILLTEDDGVVYVKLHHIKSVCKTVRPDKTDVEAASRCPIYSEAYHFSDVFKELEHKWVAINPGGPEAMEGVLVEKSGDFYPVICDHTVLRIHPFHILSISTGQKGSLKQNSSEKNDEKKDNYKDGKNKDKTKDNTKDKNNDKNKDAKDKTQQNDGSKDKSKNCKEKDEGKGKNKDSKKKNEQNNSTKDTSMDSSEKTKQ